MLDSIRQAVHLTLAKAHLAHYHGTGYEPVEVSGRLASPAELHEQCKECGVVAVEDARRGSYMLRAAVFGETGGIQR